MHPSCSNLRCRCHAKYTRHDTREARLFDAADEENDRLAPPAHNPRAERRRVQLPFAASAASIDS